MLILKAFFVLVEGIFELASRFLGTDSEAGMFFSFSAVLFTARFYLSHFARHSLLVAQITPVQKVHFIEAAA